jgi:hypothetical protein
MSQDPPPNARNEVIGPFGMTQEKLDDPKWRDAHRQRLRSVKQWFWRGVWLLLGLAMIPGALFLSNWSFQKIEQMRQLERIPQTTAAALIGGQTMLAGTARPIEGTVRADDSKDEVLYYEAVGEEHSGRENATWKEVERESDGTEFAVETADGSVIVDTTAGDFELDAEISHRRQLEGEEKRRITERSIYPGDEVFLVGVATPTDDGHRIVFDADENYIEPVIAVAAADEPGWKTRLTEASWQIIPTAGTDYERRWRLAAASLGLLVAGVAMVLFAIYFLMRAFRVAHTAAYLGATSVSVLAILAVQGLAMMAGDLRAADDALDQTLAAGERAADHLMTEAGVDPSDRFDAFESLDDPAVEALAEDDRRRLSQIRVTVARHVERTNAGLFRFPEIVVGPAVGVLPRSGVDLSPAERERLKSLEEDHSPVRLELHFAGLALAIGLFGAVKFTRRGLERVRRKRTIQNVPTSPVEGVAYGLTELRGRVEPCDEGGTLRAPLSDRRCVSFVHLVQKKTDDEWRTVERTQQSVPFYCRDQTGRLLVDPTDARVWAMRSIVRKAGSSKRKIEQTICPDDDLYVLGPATVDPKTPTRLMIANSDDDTPFVVSTIDSQELLENEALNGFSKLNWGVVTSLVAGVGVAATVASFSPATYVIAAAFCFGYMSVVLGILYYNDLVFLRDRVDRARANIDVALKKRFDLVSRLADVAEEFFRHERSLHARLVEARKGGPDKHLVDELMASLEDHPELRGETVTKELMDGLKEVEDDIALMRDGYNDAVERYNDRVEKVPERIIALLFSFKRADYLEPEQPAS